MILLSAVLAVMVNVSTFLIIGNTSAITYNVVGHLKLSMVLFFGFLAFESRMNLVNFGGVLVAFAGIFGYSYLKLLS